MIFVLLEKGKKMKLIDADEVQKILKHIRGKYVNRLPKANQLFWDTIRYIEKKVRSIPTVEAKEVVHGEWINEYINRYGHPCHCCSVCGFHASYQDKNFCPNCGADMRTSAE